jgi:predicted AAA+ superfamily ATPase
MVERVYDAIVREHLEQNRQIAMISGPRQVGKTTSSRTGAGDHAYYSWDRQSDRALITRGADAVAADLGVDALQSSPRHVVFDEIHKYRSWRSFLKGFFDVYSEQTRSVVTGSARLGHFRRGGDSLMGRYFLYRMHPLSVGELARQTVAEEPVRPPQRIERSSLSDLLRFGGYPEPFLRAETRFYNQWRRMRTELLFREDLRDLTRIQEAGQVEVLGELLADRAGQLVNYSNLAADANVAVDTAKRWVAALEALYFCFTVRPWHANVPKSLRKQPKVFLWDWSMVASEGARRENFVASHLLKAVDWWTDTGLGDFGLYYLRDKAKREVDFLVTRDGAPWFLAEVKSSGGRSLSPALHYYQQQTGAAHAFQVAVEAEYVDADCFARTQPVEVPALTLLSQLV